MRVIWSPHAVERVAEIAAFIAADRPDAARRWVEELFDAANSLAAFPEQGRNVPELHQFDYRELLFGQYRVIYRLERTKVNIITVRHGRRLFDASEFEDME